MFKTMFEWLVRCCWYGFLLLVICASVSSQGPGAMEAAMQTITAGDLMGIVTHLASPRFEGRLAGDEGYNRAAAWVAAEFERFGLKPGGDGGTYFQHFDVEYNRIEGPAVLAMVADDSVRQIYTIGSDFVARGFSGQGLMTSPVVFCGFGISSPENHYDDYEDIDASDSIVMMFKGAPPWEGEWDDLRLPRMKAGTAHRHGAVGMLLISEPGQARSEALIGSVYHGPGEHLLNFPSLHVSHRVANDLLRGSGVTVEELLARLTEYRQPCSFPLQIETHMEIHARYREKQETMNVIGYVEGADPRLKDEVVILGAHLDHVGSQADAVMFPGANDNASGVAALIEMAEALSLMEDRPKRSVLFIAFSAEEQGMLGSQHYVDYPVRPLNRTTSLINIDCIGSGAGMRIGGGEDCPDLFHMAQDMNETYTHFTLPSSGRGGGADAEPFYKIGIPTLYFATTGGYAHLHQSTDRPETLNSPLFEKAARLAFLTLWETANE